MGKAPDRWIRRRVAVTTCSLYFIFYSLGCMVSVFSPSVQFSHSSCVQLFSPYVLSKPICYSCLHIIKSRGQLSFLTLTKFICLSWKAFFLGLWDTALLSWFSLALVATCFLAFSVVTCFFMLVLSHVWFFVTPWTIAHQAPLSMGFSRQEYWNGLPSPPPGDLPNPGIKPTSPVSLALAGEFFTTEPPGKTFYKSLNFDVPQSWVHRPLSAPFQLSRVRFNWSGDGEMKVNMKSLSHVQVFVITWTVAHEAPPSMEFFWARVLEGVAFSFSRRSSWPRDRIWVSHTASRCFLPSEPWGKLLRKKVKSISRIRLFVTPWTVVY